MDNFPTLKIIIGLPGSGKSTYCKDYVNVHKGVHISSDEIRKELYGDENIQGDPQEVFTLMNNKTLENLDKGNTVLYHLFPIYTNLQGVL